MFALTSFLLVQLSRSGAPSGHVYLLQHAYELQARSAGNTIGEKSEKSGRHRRTHQSDPTATGGSASIGNAISVWLADAISGPHGLNLERNKSNLQWPETRFSFFKYIECPGVNEMCFGKHLFNSRGEVPLNEEQLATVNAEMHAGQHPGQMLYLTSVIKAAGVPMGNILGTKKVEYLEAFDPDLLAPLPSRHCIVHYRVGDFAEYTQHNSNRDAGMVSAKSVVAAMASFHPGPLTVEILNGGASHFDANLLLNHSQGREDTEEAKSFRALQKLKDAISEAFPDAQVSLSGNRTADEDWFRLSQAPLAVVSMGSFGVSAVMAGTNNQVRSPATQHLLNVHNQIAPTQLRPGWTTYQYELEDWNTM